MKISGFTIVRNALKFNYPAAQSIKSILPICDEFVVNVGDCEDKTLELIQSISSPKLKIIRNNWDFSEGEIALSKQTNIALAQCKGDWAFYLQGDEVVHEKDLPILKRLMHKYVDDESVDALRFKWLHFYGSFYRYRIDAGWFQKEDRIIKNNGQIHSYSGAFGFERKDKNPLKRKNTGCFIYHYGWIHSPEVMTQRRVNAERIGFTKLVPQEREENYDYGDLERFPIYFGTHPDIMQSSVLSHELSQKDWATISRKYWWSPLKIFRIRYKTFKRSSKRIC